MSYKLHQKLNVGGMAELWVATKEGADTFKKACAIKVIRSDLGDRDDFARMFMAEAKILSNMNHANIMPVMDLTMIDHSPAIVMDLNIGGDLNQIFRQCFDAGALIPIPMLLFVVASVAQGLHYAHNFKDPMTGQPLGVVHRDISPGNILLAVDGKVRVSDFGIAKAANRGFETDAGQVKGKYAYMSPEQLQNKALDHRSDIFSLGVVLWEGLAGRFRFGQLPELAIYEKLAQTPRFESLLDLNLNVSAALNDIVMKCLTVDPHQRYRSAADLARDLDRQLMSDFSSFSSEKLGKFVERSLKSQVDQIQQMLQRALAVGTDKSESIQSQPLQMSVARDPVEPKTPFSQLASQEVPKVVRSTPSQTSQEAILSSIGVSSDQVRSINSQEDQKKINITVHVAQSKPEDQGSFLHKGKELTLSDALPTNIQPKISASKPNLRPVLQHSQVTMRRDIMAKGRGRSSSGILGLLLAVLLAAALAWIILNAPMIRQFIKSMKVG